MSGTEKEPESPQDFLVRYNRSIDEMDKYLDAARELFESGDDGGREGIIRYLIASVSLIETSSGEHPRSVVPLHVLIHALRGLKNNYIHPILKPNSEAGRPKGNDMRDFAKALSVRNADWLHAVGFKRQEADAAIAKVIDGKLPTEHAEDRITGTTVRNWRSAIGRATPDSYLRRTHESLAEITPHFILSKEKEQARTDLVMAFSHILKGLRLFDL